jgi:hypothetical protein
MTMKVKVVLFYLVVAEGHVAGGTKLEHAGTEGLELVDSKAKGLDTVGELFATKQNPDDCCCS